MFELDASLIDSQMLPQLEIEQFEHMGELSVRSKMLISELLAVDNDWKVLSDGGRDRYQLNYREQTLLLLSEKAQNPDLYLSQPELFRVQLKSVLSKIERKIRQIQKIKRSFISQFGFIDINE